MLTAMIGNKLIQPGPLLPVTNVTYIAPLSSTSSDMDSPASLISAISASTTQSTASGVNNNLSWAHCRQHSSGASASALPTTTSRQLAPTHGIQQSPAGLDHGIKYVHTTIPVSVPAIPTIADPITLDTYRLVAASAAPQYAPVAPQPITMHPMQHHASYYNDLLLQTASNLPPYPAPYNNTMKLLSQAYPPAASTLPATMQPIKSPPIMPQTLQPAVPLVSDALDPLGTLRRDSLMNQNATGPTATMRQFAQKASVPIQVASDNTLPTSLSQLIIPASLPVTLPPSLPPSMIPGSGSSVFLPAQLAPDRSDPWRMRISQLEAELKRAREEIEDKSAILESIHAHTSGTIARDIDPQEIMEALRKEVKTAMLEVARDSAETKERLKIAEKTAKISDPYAVAKLENKLAELERRLGDAAPSIHDSNADNINELRDRLTDIEGVLALTQEELTNSMNFKEIYERTTIPHITHIRQLQEKCDLLQNFCKELEHRVKDQDCELHRVRAMSFKPFIDTLGSPNSLISNEEQYNLEKALVALQLAEQRIETLDDKISKLTIRSQENELAYLTANHEMEGLRVAFNEEKTSAAQKIYELEQLKTTLVKTYDLRITQYAEDNVRLQSEVNCLERELKRTVDELQIATNDKNMLMAGCTSLSIELEKLKESNAKASAAADELEVLPGENLADLEHHTKYPLNHDTSFVDNRNSQIERLENLLKTYQKSGLSLTDGTTADPSTTEKIISELADSRSKLTSLEAQNEVLTSMLSQQREQHDNEIKKLRSDLDAAERRVIEASARLEGLKSGDGNGSFSLPELENMVSNLQTALQDKSEDANQLKSLLSNLSDELLTKDQTMNDMLRRYTTLEKRNIELLERHATR